MIWISYVIFLHVFIQIYNNISLSRFQKKNSKVKPKKTLKRCRYYIVKMEKNNFTITFKTEENKMVDPDYMFIDDDFEVNFEERDWDGIKQRLFELRHYLFFRVKRKLAGNFYVDGRIISLCKECYKNESLDKQFIKSSDLIKNVRFRIYSTV